MKTTKNLNVQTTGESEGWSAMEFCGAVTGVLIAAQAIKIVGTAIDRKVNGEPRSRVPEIIIRGKLDPQTGEATLTVIDQEAERRRAEEAKKAAEKAEKEAKEKAEKEAAEKAKKETIEKVEKDMDKKKAA